MVMFVLYLTMFSTVRRYLAHCWCPLYSARSAAENPSWSRIPRSTPFTTRIWQHYTEKQTFTLTPRLTPDNLGLFYLIYLLLSAKASITILYLLLPITFPIAHIVYLRVEIWTNHEFYTSEHHWTWMLEIFLHVFTCEYYTACYTELCTYQLKECVLFLKGVNTHMTVWFEKEGWV